MDQPFHGASPMPIICPACEERFEGAGRMTTCPACGERLPNPAARAGAKSTLSHAIVAIVAVPVLALGAWLYFKSRDAQPQRGPVPQPQFPQPALAPPADS